MMTGCTGRMFISFSTVCTGKVGGSSPRGGGDGWSRENEGWGTSAVQEVKGGGSVGKAIRAKKQKKEGENRDGGGYDGPGAAKGGDGSGAGGHWGRGLHVCGRKWP